jgi:hypothetical protein
MQLSLCFYFPYHEVSGVPLLFARMANTLIKNSDVKKIVVIDYSNGAIARNLIDSPFISLLPFEDGKKITAPEDCILIMQAIIPYSIRSELIILPQTRVVFWNLHPDNLVPVLLPFPYLRNLQNRYFGLYKILLFLFFKPNLRRLREFVQLCIDKNALLFMDQPNFDKLCKYLFIELPNVIYLPVPSVPVADTIPIRLRSNDVDKLNFCWVGRLCDFKSHLLIYTIQKLSKLSEERELNIKYYVVGVGPFEEQISALKVNNTYFSLIMKGGLVPAELDRFLMEEVDVLTAMGTSALEGAKFGIPVILLDISYYPIKGDYLFRWLHDTINFDLGHDITHKDIKKGNNSLKQMLNDLLYNYKKLSDVSYSYFIKNHDIEIVSNLVIKNATESNFCFSDIDKRLLHKSLLRRMYDKSRGYLNLNMYL